MVYKICPRQNVPQKRRVSAVPGRNALHIWCQIAASVERLPFLDLIHHLAHIHLDFSVVFCPAIESYCQSETKSVFARSAKRGWDQCIGDIQELLSQARNPAAIIPIAHDNLKTGGKAPLPAKEGAKRSVASMNAGPMAPIPVP
jgi:hypothetical protein